MSKGVINDDIPFSSSILFWDLCNVMNSLAYHIVWNNVGLVYRLYSNINLGIIWVWKYLTNWVWFAHHSTGWDHIAMVCENWIFWLISYSIGNNILGTLIYIHTQLFMSINAMVWISIFLRCKAWVVNCNLLLMNFVDPSSQPQWW